MKRLLEPSVVLCSALAFMSFPAKAESDFLPNWLSPNLEQQDGLPPVNHSPATPLKQFRVPAEYEPIDSVILGWADASTAQFLSQIANVVANDAGANVIAAAGPKTIEGVPVKKYIKSNCQVDTVWVRDYGPISGVFEDGKVGFFDSVYRHYQARRKDDAIPACLGQELKMDSYGTELILDGGNFLMDSARNLFTTNRTYLWNSKFSKEAVDFRLKERYGATEIHVLEYAGSPNQPADGTGHIDMFVKLLSASNVLISEATSEPFRSAVESAVKYFQSIKSPEGVPYQIVRVPGWYENEIWYTYTNSLLVNGVALVPSYSYYPTQNNIAKKAYENAGFKVRMISSDRTIGKGGSIHCVTQTVPAVTH